MPRPVTMRALPVVGGDGCEMDFPQIDRCLHRTGCRFRLRYLDADVQLKAPVPDEGAGPGGLGKSEGQDERRVAFAHRQNDAPLLAVDGLSGPLDRVEAFLAPGILHAHLGMLPAQRTGRFDIGEKGVHDLLHGLSIEGEPAFGGLLQLPLPRPRRVDSRGLFYAVCMQRFHTRAASICAALRRRKSDWRQGRFRRYTRMVFM